MDVEKLIEDTEWSIDWHENHVETVREILNSPDDNRSIVDMTIFIEYDIVFAIEYLENQDVSTSALREGLEEVRERNRQLEEDFPDAFEQQFVHELVDEVDQFPSTVCYALELDPINNEAAQTFSQRDLIEVLFMYLDDSAYPSDLRPRVESLDEVLKCLCGSLRAETYAELQEQVARPYYPERFWWRHPEDVLAAE